MKTAELLKASQSVLIHLDTGTTLERTVKASALNKVTHWMGFTPQEKLEIDIKRAVVEMGTTGVWDGGKYYPPSLIKLIEFSGERVITEGDIMRELPEIRDDGQIASNAGTE